MSGRGVVMLHRVTPVCPSCGAERYPSTGPLGTQIAYPHCHPETCRRARLIALAGRYQEVAEPLPSDDRTLRRRPSWARSGAVA